MEVPFLVLSELSTPDLPERQQTANITKRLAEKSFIN